MTKGLGHERWQAALEDTLKAFAADSGTIHIVDDRSLALVAHVGMPDALLPTIDRIPLGKGMAGLAAQRNVPVDSCDIQTDDTGDVRPGARSTSLKGALAVPMRGPTGAVLGVLGLGSLGVREWSADARTELLKRAADMVRAPPNPEGS